MNKSEIINKKFRKELLEKAKKLGFKKGTIYKMDGVEYTIKGDLFIREMYKIGKGTGMDALDYIVINHKNSNGYIYDTKTDTWATIVKNKIFCMDSAYYILILRQIGNIGAKEIFKIDDQPREGFSSESEAEKHLEKLFNEGKYPYDNKWRYDFMISKLYSNVS
jgi:hypothetical protein